VKRLLMTLAIACVLSTSAIAGDIPSVGAPAPPPQSIGTMDTTNSTSPGGDIPISGKSDLSSEALSALLSALSFLGI